MTDSSYAQTLAAADRSFDPLQAARAAQMARSGSSASPGGAPGGSVTGPPSREEIAETARSFEAQVIGQLLQPMFSSLDIEPPFGGGHGEKVWRSMLVDEYGKAVMDHGGIGISDAVMRAMLDAQEA